MKMTDAAEIAKRLTKAQRKVMMAMKPDKKKHRPFFPEYFPEAIMIKKSNPIKWENAYLYLRVFKALARKGLVEDVDGTTYYWSLTPLGLAVKRELEKEEES